MKPESFIAKRYLSTTRHSSSVNLLKWIGTVGVALGVCSLVVVISIMRGFERDFESKIIGFQAPVTIEVTGDEIDLLPTLEELKAAIPSIRRAERRIEGELVIETGFGTSAGARVRGVEGPLDEVPGLGRVQMAKDRELMAPGGDSQLPPIVLGTELAASLQVHPDFGDEVRLVFPFGDVSPSGELLPRIRKFDVRGLFDSGFYEYDHKFAIVPAKDAERLLGSYGRVTLALELADPAASETVATSLAGMAGERPWKVSTWQSRNQRLFQALMLERLGMWVLLTMIVLIASFSIFALLSIIVLEKVADMAVLRSMGLKLKQVRRIFLWQAGQLGLRGTVVGGLIGLIICISLKIFPYRLPPSYYIEYLPIVIEPLQITIMVLVGPLVSLIAGLYPAWQATRYGIAGVLRYE